MFCERCKDKDATIHLTEIIKDVKSEIHLCEGCAREIGLNSKLSNFSLSIPEMLSFLDVQEVDDLQDSTVCLHCGFSFLDYNRMGRLGCPQCYAYLSESLKPVIVAYHGTEHHIGKSPRQGDAASRPAQARTAPAFTQPGVEDLKPLLDKAVLEERYEDAAVLRDRIKELMDRCESKIV